MKKVLSFAAMSAAMVLFACNGNSSDNSQSTTTNTTTTTDTTSAPKSMVTDQSAPAATASNDNVKVNGNTVEVNLQGSDDMKYNVTAISAKEGQTIKVKMTNAGRLPKESMGHNFILLKPGTVIADFATKAMNAKATDYIPASEKANIIAHSKLLGPGESDNVEFKAPAAGTYDYICSFPGHYGSMHGVLTVTK